MSTHFFQQIAISCIQGITICIKSLYFQSKWPATVSFTCFCVSLALFLLNKSLIWISREHPASWPREAQPTWKEFSSSDAPLTPKSPTAESQLFITSVMLPSDTLKPTTSQEEVYLHSNSHSVARSNHLPMNVKETDSDEPPAITTAGLFSHLWKDPAKTIQPIHAHLPWFYAEQVYT